MDNEELAALEQELLSLMTAVGLDWVRANAEDRIAAGRQTTVEILRDEQWREEEAVLFETRRATPGETAATRGRRFPGNVRLAPSERVLVVIQALQRYVTELPEIHQSTMKYLVGGQDERDAPVVTSLRFLPDVDDAVQPPPTLEQVRATAATEAREAVANALALMEREIAG